MRKEMMKYYRRMDGNGRMGLVDRWKWSWLYCEPWLYLAVLATVGLMLYKNYSFVQALVTGGLTIVLGMVLLMGCTITHDIMNSKKMPEALAIILAVMWAIGLVAVICVSAVLVLTSVGVFT